MSSFHDKMMNRYAVIWDDLSSGLPSAATSPPKWRWPFSGQSSMIIPSMLKHWSHYSLRFWMYFLTCAVICVVTCVITLWLFLCWSFLLGAHADLNALCGDIPEDLCGEMLSILFERRDEPKLARMCVHIIQHNLSGLNFWNQISRRAWS